MKISEFRYGDPCRRSTVLDSVDPMIHRISELSLNSDRSPCVSLDGRSRFLRDFSLTLFPTRNLAGWSVELSFSSSLKYRDAKVNNSWLPLCTSHNLQPRELEHWAFVLLYYKNPKYKKSTICWLPFQMTRVHHLSPLLPLSRHLILTPPVNHVGPTKRMCHVLHKLSQLAS
jgi:hypothetical protein